MADKNPPQTTDDVEEEDEEIDYDSLRSGSPEALAIVDKANDELEKLTEAQKLTPETLAKVLGDFEKAFAVDATCVDALLGKAYVQGLMLTPDATRATLEKALEIAPNDPRILDMLEALIEGDGDSDDDDDEDLSNLSPEELKKRLDNGDIVLVGDEGEEDLGEIGGGADVSKLISKDGVMSKRFREILDEIFLRFADDAHKEKRLWTEEALDKFHQTVNDKPIAKESIQFLKENFEVDPKTGLLTAVGFMQFYLYQTASDGKETLSDLTKLGYDADLNKI